MTIRIPVEVTAAEQDVLTAAGWVVNSYRAGGGYTTPLSINLQRLTVVVDAWHKAMHTHALDSDVNGFDRSAVLEQEGGHSNEQSAQDSAASSDAASPHHAAQRRGCGAASATKKPSRSVRPRAAS